MTLPQAQYFCRGRRCRPVGSYQLPLQIFKDAGAGTEVVR